MRLLHVKMVFLFPSCRFIPGGNTAFIYSSSGQARGSSCMCLTNSPAPSLVHGSSQRMTAGTSNFQSDVNKAGLCDTCFTGRDKDRNLGDEECRHSRPGLFLAPSAAVSRLPGAAATGFRRLEMLSAFIRTCLTCRHNISPTVPHARLMHQVSFLHIPQLKEILAIQHTNIYDLHRRRSTPSGYPNQVRPPLRAQISLSISPCPFSPLARVSPFFMREFPGRGRCCPHERTCFLFRSDITAER